jgi:Zn-dependent protease
MHWGLAAAQYVVFAYSTVCHEAAHAFAALRLGDDTAAKGGQVSLDPIPHIRREPFGMVLVPLLGLLSGGYIIGWASTPYSPAWAQAHPKRAALMGLAGPAANLGLVLAAAALIHGGIFLGYFHQPGSIRFEQVVLGVDEGWSGAIAVLVSLVFSLNLLLLLFNLLPVPPLDGAAALALLPGGDAAAKVLRSPQLRIVGLLLAWKLFPYIYEPLQTMALNLLYPGAGYR